MTAPLLGDGSNFPCKGYLTKADRHVTASFTAGQAASFSLTGSATHGGGSCQVSLSYDNGQTFKVVQTILGGCPLQNTYNFNMPAGLPAGNNVVFSWSWFNKVGNREMYQNCALVNIIGTGSQSYLSTLPDMQVANVGKGCNTAEGIEAIPNNPGTLVQYGGSYSAGASSVNGNFGAGFVGSSCGVASPNQVGSGSVNTPVVIPTNTPVTTVAVVAPASSSASLVAVVSPSPAPAPAPVSAPAPAGSCSTSGTIICTGIGYTWSQCVNGSPVAMGAVAPGTICINGAMDFDRTGGKGLAVAAGSATSIVTKVRPVVKTIPVRPTVQTSKASKS